MASFNTKIAEIDEVEMEMPNYMVTLVTDLVGYRRAVCTLVMDFV